MAGQSKGSKKLRRSMRTGRHNAQKVRTTRNIAARRRKFERRIEAQIDATEKKWRWGTDVTVADNLRAHLRWSIGRRRRSVG